MSQEALYSVVIILIVVTGMAARSKFPKLPAWSVMSLAAFIAVVPGPLSVDQIPAVVNFEVLFFLVGMFSIVALAESSGLLDAVAYWFLGLFKTRRDLAVGGLVAVRHIGRGCCQRHSCPHGASHRGDSGACRRAIA